MNGLIHDFRAAVRAALDTWARCRWLRRTGGCPDNAPF